jgi:hypothetical protein
VTYQLVIENTGTVGLGNLSLVEDLATQFGSAFVDARNLTLTASPSHAQSSILLDSSSWNGNANPEMMDTSSTNLLAVGDSFTVQFDVEVDPREVTAPLENQVTGKGDAVDNNGNSIPDSSGNPIVASDLSDSGADPGSSNPGAPGDNGTSDDPVPFLPPEVPLGEITGTVFQDNNGDGIQQTGEGGIGGVEITLTGTDVLGNPVVATIFTDANGRFAFSGLNAGNYSITQTQPNGFTDGVENGDPSTNVGDDIISNIQLGWGESFGTNTFAERLPGASGNPASLPSLAPNFNSPISRLVSSYVGGPGPIYSGVPINSNANPLSLDSGRAVTGGYSATGLVDCGCPTPVEACEQRITEVVSEDCCSDAVVTEQPAMTEAMPQVIHEVMDGEINDCGQSETVIPCEEVIPCATENHHRRPSFLKRINNWLNRCV